MKSMHKKPLILFSLFLASALLVFFFVFFITQKRNLSDLESTAFEQQSTPLMNYFEEIDTDTELGENERFINYALESYYAETAQQKLTSEQVQNYINDRFINTSDITSFLNEAGSYSFSDKNIDYDPENQTLEIHKEFVDHKEIIRTPITKYVLTSVKKRNNTYYAKYDKYTFNDPYTIINRTSQDDVTGEHSVKDYLAGNGTSLALKELLNATNAKDIAKPQKQLEVTFELIDGHLKIKSYN